MTTLITDAARFYTRLVTLELDIEHGRLRAPMTYLTRVQGLRDRAFKRYWRRKTELTPSTRRESQETERN